ncbi:n-acetylglutamate synthase [Cytophagaceae bacterium ABcell3]|nr:n-acetylglutamate synthase [Cytophagaceae bacterium ABcell3]
MNVHVHLREKIPTFYTFSLLRLKKELLKMINYNNRTFKSIGNSENGEVSDETVFHYFQEGNIVWANYSGGQITKGTLIAKAAPNGVLEMVYQHINKDNEIRTGKCTSTPEVLPDGKVKLHESWQWTSGDFSEGNSVIIEV